MNLKLKLLLLLAFFITIFSILYGVWPYWRDSTNHWLLTVFGTSVVSMLSGFYVAVTTHPFWLTYVHPYLYWYGIITALLFAWIVWPRALQPRLRHSTAAPPPKTQESPPSAPVRIPSATTPPVQTSPPPVAEAPPPEVKNPEEVVAS